MNQDEHYMRRCFALAEQGRFTCRPNPVVGCVVVKDGHIVGEGWHAIAGQAHAEVLALTHAGIKASGATAYVSLEPCVHHGRTGPCTDALIASGIARLVFGMEDPNPLVSGKGIAKLHEAGISVEGPLLAEEAAALNPGFVKRMTQGLPYVRCKVGMSLDARTALANGESQWITGPEARHDVQLLRARSCAIVTGISTVECDNPALTVRLSDFAGTQPLRVVVDTDGRIPLNAKILQQEGDVVLACSVEAGQQLVKHGIFQTSDRTARCTIAPLGLLNSKVNLKLLLQQLAKNWQCNEVLVEAGATLTGALIAAGLVDELITYIAPSLLGDTARPLVVLPELTQLAHHTKLQFIEVAMIGEDCKIRSRPLVSR